MMCTLGSDIHDQYHRYTSTVLWLHNMITKVNTNDSLTIGDSNLVINRSRVVVYILMFFVTIYYSRIFPTVVASQI